MTKSQYDRPMGISEVRVAELGDKNMTMIIYECPGLVGNRRLDSNDRDECI